jgi:hypothetical protein
MKCGHAREVHRHLIDKDRDEQSGDESEQSGNVCLDFSKRKETEQDNYW